MRQVFLTSLLLVLLPLLSSCQSPDQGKYRGYLYFTQGSYLMRFSMRDFSLEAVTHLGDNQIREISDFGDDRLLISETVSVNRKRVARISWLDLKTGRSLPLYSGMQARYIASADAIVYDEGSEIYSITQEDGAEITTPVLSHRRHQLAAMIEVSNGRLLLETREDGVPKIQSYQVEDGALTLLEPLARVCSLKGAVWIDDLELLACQERNQADGGAAGDYVFADLDGRIHSKPDLPGDKKFLALTYISDQGALVLKESWRGSLDGQQKSAVWVHDVRSGENHELSDSLDLGSSVVYSVY